MKRIIIIALFLFGCSDKEFNTDTGLSDSLSVYLDLAKEDSILHKKRLEYNHKALAILLNQENDSINRKNLFKVANRFYNMNQPQDYFKVSKKILENSITKKDNASTAKAYSYIGDYYTNTSKNDSAFLYYTKAKKIYTKLKDNINLGGIYVSIAILQNYENDFSASELSAVQALNTLKGTNENAKIYEAYNILGANSFSLKDYEKAIEYHNKALNFAKENNLSKMHEEASSLNNLGSVYQNQSNHSLAISKFRDALKNKRLFFDSPKIYATLIDNLAYSQLKLKDFSELPDLFYKSLKIRDSLKMYPSVAYTKIHLSEFYQARHDTLMAKKFARQALDLSRKIKSSPDLLLSLKQIGIVDTQNFSSYSNEYIKLADSLQQAERRSKDKFARISFETDEYILQNDKLTEQNKKIIFSAVILILFGTLVFIIKNQRSKNKEFLLKQEQQKANEEIYQLILNQQIKFNEGREKEKKRIAKELHDGIMNKLAAIRLNLFILEKRTDPETIAKCINHISEIHSVEKEIRNISHDFHLENFATGDDYAALLKTLANSFDEAASLKIRFELDDAINWTMIPAIIKMHTYRILQESINNGIKHSNANTLIIAISKHENLLILKISDNGRGFNTQSKSASLGIKNINYRTSEMNGKCKIDSSPNGTIISITIPLQL